MPTPSRDRTPKRNPVMESLCECLPNCTKALGLVERGIERELTLRERISLKYHGRLCPFCACATGKFEAAKARMAEAARERSRQ
jgi:hypothetical protein